MYKILNTKIMFFNIKNVNKISTSSYNLISQPPVPTGVLYECGYTRKGVSEAGVLRGRGSHVHINTYKSFLTTTTLAPPIR